jgi:hypothetical protein
MFGIFRGIYKRTALSMAFPADSTRIQAIVVAVSKYPLYLPPEKTKRNMQHYIGYAILLSLLAGITSCATPCGC